MVLDKLKDMKNKMGDMNEMRKKAMQMQNELKKEKIEVTEGSVKVVMTGNQKVKNIEISGEEREDLVKAVNKAIKKSQKVAAQKLRGMGGFGL